MNDHTEWCAQDHRCNLREHRSEPLVWSTEYGRLVITQVHGADGDRTEVLASVRLPDELPGRQARWLAVAVDLAVRAILRGHRGWLGPVYRRVAGVRGDSRHDFTTFG